MCPKASSPSADDGIELPVVAVHVSLFVMQDLCSREAEDLDCLDNQGGRKEVPGVDGVLAIRTRDEVQAEFILQMRLGTEKLAFRNISDDDFRM